MIGLLVILDAPQILCNATLYLVWQIFQHFFALTFASFTMIIKLKSMKQSFNVLISTRFCFVCLYCLSAKMTMNKVRDVNKMF